MTPNSVGKICIAIGEAQPSNIEEAILKTRSQAGYLELRLDYLKDPNLCLSTLRNWQRLADIPLIVTLRRKANGGAFAGSEAEQIAILRTAVEADVPFIDLEIETIENCLGGELFSLRKGATQFIASYHNFEETPADLEAIYQRLKRVRPDLVKIATLAQSFSDNFRLLGLIEKAKRENLSSIVVAMGELGVYSRIMAPGKGALLTYGSIDKGRETAPGQLLAADLKDLYSVSEIDAGTRVYGVIGFPIGHSLSPHVHNPAFRAMGLNSCYLPFSLKDLRDFGPHLRRFAGFSVTIPHKVGILEYVDEVDVSVKSIGAANTLVKQNDKFRAYNTDVDGIRYALRNALKEGVHQVILLGTGGAARSAALVLKEASCHVTVLARNREKARLFAQEFGFAYNFLSEASRYRGDLLINSTPVGMFPHTDETPLPEDSTDYRYVFDMVYNPIETRLLRESRSKATVISGVEMFVAQAAKQFELWTGLEAPRDLMEAVVVRKLSAVQ
jgi:3-dehydroquinate dehydratase/shikimate dehydrogenase